MFLVVDDNPEQNASSGAAPSLGLKTNLVAWWELNEASGDALDSHANGLTLTDQNTVTSAAGIGGVGTARQFTAANSEALLRGDDAYNAWSANDITFVVWVYLASKPVSARPILGMARSFMIWYLGSASDRFQVKASGNGGHDSSAQWGSAPSTATWYMISCRYKHADRKADISVNAGTPVVGGDHTDSDLNTGPAYNWGLGAEGYDYPGVTFDGRMAKFGFWKSASGGGGYLTDAQITSIYNSGAGVSYAQL